MKQEFNLKTFEEEIINAYKRCLTCDNILTDKDMKKNKHRCKKCQREYAKVWPETSEQFYKMFEGQI